MKVGSTCSLSLSQECLAHVYDNLDFFRDKLVLRPSEISNHPEIIRRLGIIAMNTAIEVDLYGCVNSSHICGTRLMNGIGGSGDFARNAYVSIFTCPSTQKGGMISSIVPMVTHADHTEHDVRVVATEWGVADLRGKGPDEKSKTAHRELRPPRIQATPLGLPEDSQEGPREPQCGSSAWYARYI